MGLEVTIPLKVGMLEIEFDDVAELERRLARLDVARIERAVLAALHDDRRKKTAGKKGSKKQSKNKPKKGR